MCDDLRPATGEFRNAEEAAEAGYDFVPRVCPTWTDHLAGSEARIEIYRQRYAEGVELHHELDNPLSIADSEEFIDG